MRERAFAELNLDELVALERCHELSVHEAEVRANFDRHRSALAGVRLRTGSLPSPGVAWQASHQACVGALMGRVGVAIEALGPQKQTNTKGAAHMPSAAQPARLRVCVMKRQPARVARKALVLMRARCFALSLLRSYRAHAPAGPPCSWSGARPAQRATRGHVSQAARRSSRHPSGLRKTRCTMKRTRASRNVRLLAICRHSIEQRRACVWRGAPPGACDGLSRVASCPAVLPGCLSAVARSRIGHGCRHASARAEGARNKCAPRG